MVEVLKLPWRWVCASQGACRVCESCFDAFRVCESCFDVSRRSYPLAPSFIFISFHFISFHFFSFLFFSFLFCPSTQREAIGLYNQSLAIRKEVLGEGHPFTVATEQELHRSSAWFLDQSMNVGVVDESTLEGYLDDLALA